MTKQLSGIYAALLTGFSDDGAFSIARQNAILDYVTAQNLTGLYVGGSSAEDGLMEVEELVAQQEVVQAHAGARDMTLIAHVGRASLRASIRLAKAAEQNGFQAISALPPHAYPHTEAEIQTYYATLSAATSLPLIAYEIPVRTHCALPVKLLTSILEMPGVAGLKFTSNDFFKLALLRKAAPDAVLFSGFDEILSAGLVSGADGGIGTTYNVIGSLYTALHQAVQSGDLERAQQLQCVSQDFIEVLIDVGVIPGTKLALQVLGVDSGPARAPLTLRVADAEARIKAALAAPELAPWLAKARV